MDSTRRQSAGNQLAWLAGYIDADGMIGIHRQVTGTKTITWVPEVQITTCCTETADHIYQVFAVIEVPVHRSLRKVTRPAWTDRHVLTLRGMKRTRKLLPLILPYLVTKRREAEMVLEFIASRMTKTPGTPYSNSELALVAAIKHAKKTRDKPAAPETNTRDTARKAVKIESSLFGDIEDPLI